MSDVFSDCKWLMITYQDSDGKIRTIEITNGTIDVEVAERIPDDPTLIEQKGFVSSERGDIRIEITASPGWRPGTFLTMRGLV